MIEAKSCGTVCEDRISELPEDLLVRILDLVPTKEAVATMSLSKRWQSIWTMKRTLDYKDGSDDDDHEEQGNKRKKSVWRFLDKSLQLHKAPVIESLCIELGPQCPTDVDVGKWVTSAVDRRVRVLKFKLLWSADPIRLPESLYTCKTLVQLTLSHNILVDFPSSSGCLQSLRFLDLLFVVYKDEDSLISFLSSCPILETMVVRRKKDDNIKRFTVKVPSLWFLFYDNENFNDVGDTDRCLVIDTPALEKFGIVDVSGDDCSFDRMMPCLDCAYLDTTKSYPDDNILLKSISSVLSLKLSSSQLVCCSAIYFSRLTKLIIVPERSDWMENLMALLRNSPKVKNLVVDCTRDKGLPHSWNQPSSIPECLSSNLDIFTWEEYEGREDEEILLSYILANANCLKTAQISLTPTLSLEDRQMMMEKMKDIPRVSTASQLLFI